jgi:hypothetical protein
VAVKQHYPAVRIRVELEMVQEALASGSDVSLFETGAKRLDLACKDSHEALG